MCQKNGTFNFENQFWFLGLIIIIFTKLMLCNIIFKIRINFIIYIARSINIFRVYISIIRPLSRFDCTNFKDSLIIKVINFNENLKMAHLVMLVIFHVNVITCQIFNLPHIYRIFTLKTHFLR